jgi:hypothetical protein
VAQGCISGAKVATDGTLKIGRKSVRRWQIELRDELGGKHWPE